MNNLHGIVFAYRSNPDLRELSRHRNTCSIPYGGRYRLVDFMLSNLVNAGVDDIGLIVHVSYQSLLDHVGSGKDWDASRKHGGLRILPPFGYSGRKGDGRYQGRMDALLGVYTYLQKIRQDYVVLVGGDVVANVPLDKVLEDHIQSGADITAVCARSGDRISDEDGTVLSVREGRVWDVVADPAQGNAFCAEVYIMSKKLLLSLVDHCAAHSISSFSRGVIAQMSAQLKILPWYFDGYMARPGTVDEYFARNMELLDPAVRADLFRVARPIRTKDRSDPATYYSPDSNCVSSLVSDGCIIEGEVINSILSRGVRVEKGASVRNCILMQSTTVCAGASLSYVVSDKNVTVHPGRMLMGHENYPLAIAKDSVI